MVLCGEAPGFFFCFVFFVIGVCGGSALQPKKTKASGIWYLPPLGTIYNHD